MRNTQLRENNQWKMIHNFNKKVPGNPFLVKNSDHIKGQFYEINLKKQMKEEIEIYRRRKMLKSNNIVKIYDIVEGECCEKNEWKSNNVYIITQNIPYRLNQYHSLSLEQISYILEESVEGLCELVKLNNETFFISHKMIGINQVGRIKVWVNQNFSLNKFQETKIQITSEKTMLEQLIASFRYHTNQNNQQALQEFLLSANNFQEAKILIQSYISTLPSYNRHNIGLSLLSLKIKQNHQLYSQINPNSFRKQTQNEKPKKKKKKVQKIMTLIAQDSSFKEKVQIKEKQRLHRKSFPFPKSLSPKIKGDQSPKQNKERLRVNSFQRDGVNFFKYEVKRKQRPSFENIKKVKPDVRQMVSRKSLFVKNPSTQKLIQKLIKKGQSYRERMKSPPTFILKRQEERQKKKTNIQLVSHTTEVVILPFKEDVVEDQYENKKLTNVEMDYKRMFLDENDSPNEDQCDKLVIPKLKNESKSQVLREQQQFNLKLTEKEKQFFNLFTQSLPLDAIRKKSKNQSKQIQKKKRYQNISQKVIETKKQVAKTDPKKSQKFMTSLFEKNNNRNKDPQKDDLYISEQQTFIDYTQING